MHKIVYTSKTDNYKNGDTAFIIFLSKENTKSVDTKMRHMILYIHKRAKDKYNCTYFKLTAQWKNYKCEDCYWAKKNSHFPNVYSFGTPSHTDMYGRATVTRSNGVISAALKKLLSMDISNGKTYSIKIYFDTGYDVE